MKRLTETSRRGRWQLSGVPWEALREGRTITKEVYEKLYGALCKLKDYEDTGLSPDDVIRLDDFEQSQVADLLKKLGGERRKHCWISTEEQLPETGEMVLVQVSGRPAENITLHDALALAEYNPEEGWILEMWPEWGEAKPIAWMPLPDPFLLAYVESM